MASGTYHRFAATLDRIDFHVAEEKYFRIMAGNGIFFSHGEVFTDSGVLSILRPGQKLFLGCHALDGRSYRLEWLVAPGAGRLRPLSPARNSGQAAICGTVGLALLAVGVRSALSGESDAEFGFGLWFSLFIAIAGAMVIAVSAGIARRTRELVKYDEDIRLAETGTLAGAVPPPPPPSSGGLKSDWRDPALERDRVKGVAICMSANSRALGDPWTHFRFRTFFCGGEWVSWTSEAAPLHPGRRAGKRPFFMARGDEIEAALETGQSVDDNGRKSRVALSLVNHADGGVYSMFPLEHSGMWRSFYRWAALVFLLTAVALPAFLSASVWLEHGKPSANFTIVLSAFLASLVTLAVAGAGILAEFAVNGDIVFTGGPSRKRLAEAAALYSLRHVAKIRFDGFSTRREVFLRMATLLTLGAAAYILLCLQPWSS